MNSYLFKPSQIISLSKYDDPNFNFLVDHLLANKFTVNHTYSNISDLVKFEDFFWRAKNTVINSPGVASSKRIRGDIALHTSFHHLLSKSSGHKLRGMPLFTLLSESLVSCSDFYFSLIYFSKFGMSHPMVKMYFGIYQIGSLRLNKSSVGFLNSSLENPFLVYKKCVIEFYKLSVFLLNLSKNRRLNKTVLKKIHSYKNLQIFLAYNWSGFVLYTLANCGLKSSIADKKQVKRHLKLLKNSNSMPELLEKIQTLNSL